MKPFVWPMCTMKGCEHSVHHATAAAAEIAGAAHGPEWVGHGGAAVCDCHSDTAVTEQYGELYGERVDGLSLLPDERFPCDQGADRG